MGCQSGDTSLCSLQVFKGRGLSLHSVADLVLCVNEVFLFSNSVRARISRCLSTRCQAGLSSRQRTVSHA